MPTAASIVKRVRQFIEAAGPLPVTFHRAFDLSRDLGESLDTLAELGVARILTSAGEPRFWRQLDRLSALVEQAGSALVIMPCGGIRPHNIEQVVAVPGVTEVHIGATRRRASDMNYRREGVPMGRPLHAERVRRGGS